MVQSAASLANGEYVCDFTENPNLLKLSRAKEALSRCLCAFSASEILGTRDAVDRELEGARKGFDWTAVVVVFVGGG